MGGIRREKDGQALVWVQGKTAWEKTLRAAEGGGNLRRGTCT